jgi:hypothetical protein
MDDQTKELTEIDLTSLSVTPGDIDVLQELSRRINVGVKKKASEMQQHLKEHNELLNKITFLGIDDVSVMLSPREYGHGQILYAKLVKEASAIAGKCRDLQRYFEAFAEQGQADFFEKVRMKKYNKDIYKTTDAQYLSRKAKGKLLEYAGEYEGDYHKWQGAAKSYELSVNSVKDLYKDAEYELRRNPNVGVGS